MSKATTNHFILIVIFTTVAAVAARADAQDTSRGKSFWINLSGGGGSMAYHRGGGDAVRAALNYEASEKMFFSLAISGVDDSMETKTGVKKDVYSAAFDVLIGKRFIRPGLGFVSASTGLSVVTGTPRDSQPNAAGLFPEDFTTVGLPLNAQVVFAPIKWVGLGLDAFANLNLKRSNFGVGFGLYLGKVW